MKCAFLWGLLWSALVLPWAAQGAVFRLDLPDRGEERSYREMTLKLAEGDVVQFGDREFTLGPFLGKGNTTKVFALSDSLAIRIPISLHDREYVCATIENYDFIKDTELQAVRVYRELSSPSCQYAVVERLPKLFRLSDYMDYLFNRYLLNKDKVHLISMVPKKKLDEELERFFMNTYQYASLDGDFSPDQVLWNGDRFVLADWTYGFHFAEKASDERTALNQLYIKSYMIPKSWIRKYSPMIIELRKKSSCENLLKNTSRPAQYEPLKDF